MDKETLFAKLERMTKDEVFSEYNIKYYTVSDLLEDPLLGRSVKSLYERNYM
ncbi:hypothetical protein NEAUS06_1164 [Nematocida ausubeli]|nr:hypothetical protein NEAUS06_1164 [Nematocida ausubeli]